MPCVCALSRCVHAQNSEQTMYLYTNCVHHLGTFREPSFAVQRIVDAVIATTTVLRVDDGINCVPKGGENGSARRGGGGGRAKQGIGIEIDVSVLNGQVRSAWLLYVSRALLYLRHTLYLVVPLFSRRQTTASTVAGSGDDNNAPPRHNARHIAQFIACYKRGD